MRAIARTRALLSSASLLAAAAILVSGESRAACYIAEGENIFASPGDTCAVPDGGPYNAPATGVSAPLNYTGFAFLAFNGTITTESEEGPIAVTINTSPDAQAGYGVWSNGEDASVFLDGGATVTTYGQGAFGYYANNGGTIAASGPSFITVSGGTAGVEAESGGQVSLDGGGTIYSTGSGAIGIKATDSNTSVSATGIAITADGQNAQGVVADNSAVISLSNGYPEEESVAVSSVAVFGANSVGVLATNAATVYLNGDPVNNLTVSANGTGSRGLSVASGGDIQADGVAVSATGVGAGGARNNGGTLNLFDSSSVTASGQGAFGVYTTNTTGDNTGTTLTNVAISIPDANDNVASFGAVGVKSGEQGVTTIYGGSITTGVGDDNSIGIYASGSGAVVNVWTYENEDSPVGATITTNGANSPGVQADNAGQVTLDSSIVTTYGSGSPGLFATDSGSKISATNAAVETNADNAPGLIATGGASADFSGGYITTYGVVSPGIVASGSGTNVTVEDSATIQTSKDGSSGLVVSGGASLSATGVTVTTYGGLYSGTGSVAAGAYNGFGPGSSGGTLTLKDTTIVTFGDSSSGAITNSAGVTTIYGGSVTTSGDNAIGLYASGSGSSITTQPGSETAGTVIVTGAPIEDDEDNDFKALADSLPTGAYAYGVAADTAAHITLNGGSITTYGLGAAGGYATGSGSQITANNVAVTTSNDVAHGYWADQGAAIAISGGSVTTSGNGAVGLFASGSGSTITASSLALATNGARDASTGLYAFGVLGLNGGAVNFSRGSITTTGVVAPGAASVGDGSTVTLDTGASVLTTGDGSVGLLVNGSGATLSANSASVTTQGKVDSNTGDAPFGAYNGFAPDGASAGGIMNLTNADTAAGVMTNSGGVTTFSGGSVTTSGTSAPGLYATGSGSQISANNVAVTTSGDGAHAYFADQDATIGVSGGTATTSGNGAVGLFASGPGAVVTASSLVLTTKGVFDTSANTYAYGALALDGGSTSFSGGSIATTGNGSAGGASIGNGSVLKLSNGASVQTTGVGAAGLIVSGSGALLSAEGVSVKTSGQDSPALFVTGSGAQANLGGTNTFGTLGYGAIGLYVTKGGVLAATGQTNVTTTGGISPTTGLAAFGVNADGAGSKINLGSATITTSGAGAHGLFASDAASTGAAGSITASGLLTVQTANASAAGVALQGNGATVVAAGGGSITTAGNAVAFLGGANQSATFDNFTIGNKTGDLIFVDPSVATVNFNNTTADAGVNNVVNTTGGSAFTLNAAASTLTGAIRTDSLSTTSVALGAGSLWTMTGSSVVSNLSVTNSAVVFAPPGSGVGFKTLTLGDYVGSGASLTINTVLGSSNSQTDQLIINGGKATGSTLLSINNVGGLGALTTGSGIPIILATNGGSIAANAFTLANIPVVNGYRYTLEETADAWYLVSSPTATQGDVINSINSIAKSQQQLMVTNRVLSSILLGATEQINCTNCSSGFGSIGSFSLGGHGRWNLTNELTAIGGFAYSNYSADGVSVTNAPTFAGSLVYDFVNWGRSRPFVEAGLAVTPYEDVNYSRSYFNGTSYAIGNGKAVNRNAAAFGRVGWVDRVTPIDEAAVYADLSRSWMSSGGYTEATTGLNPYPATVASGLDTLNIARIAAQYTHLFASKFEVNVSAGLAYGFGGHSGSVYNVFDFGTFAPYPIQNSYWLEYGGRVGYRLQDRMVIDAFVIGTVGGQVGNTIHGGLGLRYLF